MAKSKIIEILLNNKADVNIASKHDNETPLNIALDRNDENLVMQMLKAGANINHPKRDGRTPLHIAANKGSKRIFLCTESVKFLIIIFIFRPH